MPKTKETKELKKKENIQKSVVANPSPSVAAVEELQTEPSSLVALVDTKADRKIFIDDMIVKVVKINDIHCNLIALLDSGSPISFINLACFKRFFDIPPDFQNNYKYSYKAINNTPIGTYGNISSSIQLESLSNLLLPIDLHVLKDSFAAADLIIGRNFLTNNKITVTMNFSEEKLNKRVKLFNEIASTDILHISSINSESLEDVKIDFDSNTKKELITILQEVQKVPVRNSEDNYSVKISLKDDSIYAYAPRKFAWTERLQIREITDNLLKRNIIKLSTSPYCSRVVPIRKKNGTIRLCVDLRV